MQKNMIRKSVYSIEEILPLIADTPRPRFKTVILDGDEINVFSARLRMFKNKGITCVRCGITGEYFAKEKHDNHSEEKFHLNLYAIDENGVEVLMTQDHITPKSLGGGNIQSNLQPMCAPCNQRKGNHNDGKATERVEEYV